MASTSRKVSTVPPINALREKLEQVKFAGQVGDDSQGDYRESMNTATRDQVRELVELVEMLIEQLESSGLTDSSE